MKDALHMKKYWVKEFEKQKEIHLFKMLSKMSNGILKRCCSKLLQMRDYMLSRQCYGLPAAKADLLNYIHECLSNKSSISVSTDSA